MLARTLFALCAGSLLLGAYSESNAQERKRSLLSRLLRPKQRRLDLDPRTGFIDYSKFQHNTAPDGDEQLRRAGNPHCHAPWAAYPKERHNVGYYVGGGAVFGGDRACVREGTWGWDYKLFPWTKVKLGWFHGRRYQGGEGQYSPDSKNEPLDDFTKP